MSNYVVDESRFMIPDEHETMSWFKEGEELPFGISFSEKLEGSDVWQLYASEDSNYLILAVKEDLGQRWISEGFCREKSLYKYEHKEDSYYLLISPSSLNICEVTSIRAGKSLQTALGFYSALKNSRNHNTEVNLRDGIYCQKLSVILPTYSSIPKLSDRALFLNILRDKNEPENLSSPEELPGGLPWFICKQFLRERGFNIPDVELYLQSGEAVDDFFELKHQDAIVLGPLLVHNHYQVFDTDSDKYILLFDKLWADALLATTLVSQINISSIALDGHMLYALTFPKQDPLECLNDRVFGLNAHSLIELAQAIRRSRKACPEARLKDALYVKSLGVLLPESFLDKDINDASLMQEIAWDGPFAMAPILDDIREDAILIAKN